jgi:hypothetical protein
MIKPKFDHDFFSLLACLYIHVAGSVEDMVGRMGNGVAPGEILFLVGHRPIEPSASSTLN